MEPLSKAVDAVLPAFINGVIKNVTYPFKVSDNLKALDSATDRLVATQAAVKNRVENAELQGLTQTDLVGVWLGQVDAVKEEVVEISRKYEERSRCLGSRSFNCWSNYWISKDATKKLVEVQNLLETGQFEDVAVQLVPRVREFSVASRIAPKEKAELQKLQRYINNVHDDIIGIWGMGGVGKTRLLDLIHNSYKKSSVFNDVIFITASQECSVAKLQADLSKKYGFGQGSDVGSQAQIISNYLRTRSFLLLLDDLWEQIDLEKVGIPFPLGMVNQFKRKVVITTRKLTVCGLMDVKQAHKVACLDRNDALRLFHEKVGDQTINSNTLIPSLAEQVVDELDGLPLALITIGRAMYGKKDPRLWDDAIDLLQKSRLNEIETARPEEKIYYRLKFSYDSLETDDLRDCFLTCSLWPEDHEIEKFELIEHWMGLGIMHASDARNIYNPGYTLIGKLLSACLLEDAGSDCVKMHDVVRDMALWLACDFGKHRDKWIVRTNVGVDEVLCEKQRWCHTERATLILGTLMFSNEPVVPIPCEANKLHFLKVHSFGVSLGPLLKSLNSFCSLTFLDLSCCSLNFFPPAISNLVNVRYLNLSGNHISSIPEELKLLINLMYLSLSYNGIISFPEGVISKLRELRVLDLYDICGMVKCEYITWLIKELKCLDNIRSLGITLQCAAHFESLLELPNLPIKSLKLDIPEETNILLTPGSFIGNSKIQDNLNDIEVSGKLVENVVIESNSRNSYCHLKNLERLDFYGMRMLEEIIWREVTPKNFFLKLHDLSIIECRKLKDVSWMLYLPCLTNLFLTDCDGMVQLFKQSSLTNAIEEREEMTPTFPSLVKLHLTELRNLQIICDQSTMFPSLERISIRECPLLKKLPFRSNTVPSKLESITSERIWWEQIEWEDNDLKTVLEQLFKEA